MNSDLSLKSKLPATGLTIFTRMSAMAHEFSAINLSQGFPDFRSSPKLIDLVSKHMKAGRNQYAPMGGVPALREGLAVKISSLYKCSPDAGSEITITAGATQAIYTAIAALINPGDEVLIFEPAYDCYEPAIELHGGVTRRVSLYYPDFAIDWSRVKKMVGPRTRMIIINTPHNPSATNWTERDINELRKIVEDTEIIILSDEVYEHIVFDENDHHSILRYPELASRSLAVFSFGKTFHNTGWKLGYVVAPERLMKEFRVVHQYLVFSVNTPMQFALAEFLEDPREYLSLPSFYQDKRDHFIRLLEGSKWKINPASGTYFQLLGYEGISEESDVLFAERLTREAGVAAIPISVFYKDKTDLKCLRFCFAKEKETLEQAAEKLCRI